MTIRKHGGPRTLQVVKIEADQQREARLATALRQNLHRRKAQKSARKSEESVSSGAQEDEKGPDQG
jgi:hypothetical protein